VLYRTQLLNADFIKHKRNDKIIFINIISFTENYPALKAWFDEVVMTEDHDSDHDHKKFTNFILDKKRILYKKFNFKRSVSSAWSINSIKYYAQAKKDKKNVAKFVDGDDVYQTAGNVVVRGGKILKIFRPIHAADRPGPGELLLC